MDLICPNCGEVLKDVEEKDGVKVGYCEKCDETIAFKKGRVTVTKDKSRLDKAIDLTTQHAAEIARIKKDLYGDDSEKPALPFF